MRKHVLIAILLAACGAVALAQQRSVPVQTNNTPIPLSTTTELQHNTSTTWANAVGLPTILRGVTSLPSAVTTDRPVTAIGTTTGALFASPIGNAIGGDDGCGLTTTVSTNAFNCKAQAATMYEFMGVNITATIAFVRFYNQTTSPASCSSATNFVAPPIPIPADTSGRGIVRTFPVGRAFSAGLSGCVSGAADGTTNAVAGVAIDIGAK